jgi:DNA polymerase-3 subunit gamma/tau
MNPKADSRVSMGVIRLRGAVAHQSNYDNDGYFMSYLALARRYRPGDFEQIQSQRHITKTLQNAIKLGRISHAYLFCGPRGTGKTTTARVLAKALNCVNGPTPDPCGECVSCREIAQGSSPDVFEIDAASNRGIDDIRELRENVRYTPVGGRHKIYIVDEVHRLTKEAFDALLKTLEEPPSHVIFVFATTDPQALPATILSRTQRFDFKRIPVNSLSEAVRSVAEKEGLTIEPQAALLVAKKADGSFRDALSLLDQLSGFGDGSITAEQAAEVLGLVKTEFLAAIIEATISRRMKEVLTLSGDYVKAGGDPQELADSLTGHIRTLLLIKSGVEDLELLELDQAQLVKAREMVAEADLVDLLRYFAILADYKTAVRQGQDPVYAIEATLVKMASIDNAVSLQDLLGKIQDAKSFNAGGSRITGSGGLESNLRGRQESTPSGSSSSLPRTSSQPRNEHQSYNNSSYNNMSRPDKLELDINHYDGETLSLTDSDNAVMDSFAPSGPLTIELVNAGWNGFCKQIRNDKKAIFGYLSLCKPSKIEGNTLALSVESPNNFQLEQLSRPEVKKFLEDSLRGYFKNEIRLKLAPGKPVVKGQDSIPKETNSGKLFEGATGAKELFDSLGGEIIGQ